MSFAEGKIHAGAFTRGGGPGWNRYLADYAKNLNGATTFLPTVVDTDR